MRPLTPLLRKGPAELAAEVSGRHERRARQSRDVERFAVTGVHEILGPQEMSFWRNGSHAQRESQHNSEPRSDISSPAVDLAALKSAARAAIVMPAVFALADNVIGKPQTSIFAAFGSFAMLVLVEFGGPWRTRLLGYLGLAGVGAAFITLGTLCSRNAWLAAGAMAVVGFGTLFSGAINGYFAAA